MRRVVIKGGRISGSRSKYIAASKIKENEKGTRLLFSNTESSLTYTQADNILSGGQGKPQDNEIIELIVSPQRERYLELGKTSEDRNNNFRDAIRKGLDNLWEEMGITNVRYVAGIHHNTDTSHAHILIWRGAQNAVTGDSQIINFIPKSWIYGTKKENSKIGKIFDEVFNQFSIPQLPKFTPTILGSDNSLLPARDTNSVRSERVLNAVSEQRFISPEIVESLSDSGTVYANRLGSLTYVRRNAKGQITGHQTETGFGKEDNDGFFYIGDPLEAKHFVVVENPKEMLSLIELTAHRNLSDVCFVAADKRKSPTAFTNILKNRANDNSFRVVWALNITRDGQSESNFDALQKEIIDGRKSDAETTLEFYTYAPKLKYGNTWHQQILWRELPGQVAALMTEVRRVKSSSVDIENSDIDIAYEKLSNEIFARLKVDKIGDEFVVFDKETLVEKGRYQWDFTPDGNQFVITSVNGISANDNFKIEEVLFTDEVETLSVIEDYSFRLKDQEFLNAFDAEIKESKLKDDQSNTQEISETKNDDLVPAQEVLSREESLQRAKELTAKLKAIPLEEILGIHGLSIVKDKERQEWVWRDSGQAFKIKVKDDLFSDRYDDRRGGKGAIQLWMHLNNCDFITARSEMIERFGETYVPTEKVTKLKTIQADFETEKKPLVLPPPNKYNENLVRSYLIDERKMSAAVVDHLLESGDIYANSYKSAVFLHRNPVDKTITGASWRATQGTKRQDVAGSDKNKGWFHLGNFEKAKRFVITESPIEAISYFELHKHQDLSETIIIASSGNHVPVSLLGLIEEKAGKDAELVMAFNNDKGGQNGFFYTLEKTGSFVLLRHKTAYIANELETIQFSGKVVQELPTLDDWNEDLKQYREESFADAEIEHIVEELSENAEQFLIQITALKDGKKHTLFLDEAFTDKADFLIESINNGFFADYKNAVIETGELASIDDFDNAAEKDNSSVLMVTDVHIAGIEKAVSNERLLIESKDVNLAEIYGKGIEKFLSRSDERYSVTLEEDLLRSGIFYSIESVANGDVFFLSVPESTESPWRVGINRRIEGKLPPNDYEFDGNAFQGNLRDSLNFLREIDGKIFEEKAYEKLTDKIVEKSLEKILEDQNELTDRAVQSVEKMRLEAPEIALNTLTQQIKEKGYADDIALELFSPDDSKAQTIIVFKTEENRRDQLGRIEVAENLTFSFSEQISDDTTEIHESLKLDEISSKLFAAYELQNTGISSSQLPEVSDNLKLNQERDCSEVLRRAELLRRAMVEDSTESKKKSKDIELANSITNRISNLSNQIIEGVKAVEDTYGSDTRRVLEGYLKDDAPPIKDLLESAVLDGKLDYLPQKPERIKTNSFPKENEISVISYRDKAENKIVVDTTSKAEGWSSGLSPFNLKNIELPNGIIAKNLENAWQFSKVYKGFTDESGNPDDDYFYWARTGFNKDFADRYPMGKGAKPEYAYWKGEKLNYIEARKQIYIPLYRDAVKNTEAFQKLKDLYQKENGNIALKDFDGYDYLSQGMSLKDVLLNEDKPCGHAFVLAMMLKYGEDFTVEQVLSEGLSQQPQHKQESQAEIIKRSLLEVLPSDIPDFNVVKEREEPGYLENTGFVVTDKNNKPLFGLFEEDGGIITITGKTGNYGIYWAKDGQSFPDYESTAEIIPVLLKALIAKEQKPTVEVKEAFLQARTENIAREFAEELSRGKGFLGAKVLPPLISDEWQIQTYFTTDTEKYGKTEIALDLIPSLKKIAVTEEEIKAMPVRPNSTAIIEKHISDYCSEFNKRYPALGISYGYIGNLSDTFDDREFKMFTNADINGTWGIKKASFGSYSNFAEMVDDVLTDGKFEKWLNNLTLDKFTPEAVKNDFGKFKADFAKKEKEYLLVTNLPEEEIDPEFDKSLKGFADAIVSQGLVEEAREIFDAHNVEDKITEEIESRKFIHIKEGSDLDKFFKILPEEIMPLFDSSIGYATIANKTFVNPINIYKRENQIEIDFDIDKDDVPGLNAGGSVGFTFTLEDGEYKISSADILYSRTDDPADDACYFDFHPYPKESSKAFNEFWLDLMSDQFAEQSKIIETNVQAVAAACVDKYEPTELTAKKFQVERAELITREEVRKGLVDNKFFLFGDNLARKGFGGQAKAMRGESNAFGIPTKKFPSNDESAFFTDGEYTENTKAIDKAFAQLYFLPENSTIIVPSAGLGTGLAKLQENAPKTFNYLEERIANLSSYRIYLRYTDKQTAEFTPIDFSDEYKSDFQLLAKFNGVPYQIKAEDKEAFSRSLFDSATDFYNSRFGKFSTEEIEVFIQQNKNPNEPNWKEHFITVLLEEVQIKADSNFVNQTLEVEIEKAAEKYQAELSETEKRYDEIFIFAKPEDKFSPDDLDLPKNSDITVLGYNELKSVILYSFNNNERYGIASITNDLKTYGHSLFEKSEFDKVQESFIYQNDKTIGYAETALDNLIDEEFPPIPEIDLELFERRMATRHDYDADDKDLMTPDEIRQDYLEGIIRNANEILDIQAFVAIEPKTKKEEKQIKKAGEKLERLRSELPFMVSATGFYFGEASEKYIKSVLKSQGISFDDEYKMSIAERDFAGVQLKLIEDTSKVSPADIQIDEKAVVRLSEIQHRQKEDDEFAYADSEIRRVPISLPEKIKPFVNVAALVAFPDRTGTDAHVGFRININGEIYQHLPNTTDISERRGSRALGEAADQIREILELKWKAVGSPVFKENAFKTEDVTLEMAVAFALDSVEKFERATGGRYEFTPSFSVKREFNNETYHFLSLWEEKTKDLGENYADLFKVFPKNPANPDQFAENADARRVLNDLVYTGFIEIDKDNDRGLFIKAGNPLIDFQEQTPEKPDTILKESDEKEFYLEAVKDFLNTFDLLGKIEAGENFLETVKVPDQPSLYISKEGKMLDFTMYFENQEERQPKYILKAKITGENEILLDEFIYKSSFDEEINRKTLNDEITAEAGRFIKSVLSNYETGVSVSDGEELTKETEIKLVEPEKEIQTEIIWKPRPVNLNLIAGIADKQGREKQYEYYKNLSEESALLLNLLQKENNSKLPETIDPEAVHDKLYFTVKRVGNLYRFTGHTAEDTEVIRIAKEFAFQEAVEIQIEIAEPTNQPDEKTEDNSTALVVAAPETKIEEVRDSEESFPTERKVKNVPEKSRSLLLPEIVDLKPSQQKNYEEIKNQLEERGYETLALTAKTIAIKAIPNNVEPGKCREDFLSLIEDPAKLEIAGDVIEGIPVETQSIETALANWEKPEIKTVEHRQNFHTETTFEESHTVTEQSRNYRWTDAELHNATPLQRLRWNIQAIELLKSLNSEYRAPENEEMDILARFSGWGSMKPAFDPLQEDKWKEETESLKRLLSESEYKAAESATLNSHFTSPAIVDALWQSAVKLGFKGGKALEPSAGIGVVLGRMPEHLIPFTKFTAIEKDELTAKLAKSLYQDAVVKHSGFEDHRVPDGWYDLAIGNVPFGSYKVHDERYNKLNAYIHDYFLVKSLDQVRGGGIQILITSAGTMDKADDSIRQRLAKEGKLIGAMRLPSGAFKDNAGTEVVTDILIFQKKTLEERLKDLHDAEGLELANASLTVAQKRFRELTKIISKAEKDGNDEKKIAAEKEKVAVQNEINAAEIRVTEEKAKLELLYPNWLRLGKVKNSSGEDEIEINQYFIENPEMIVGNLKLARGLYHENEMVVEMTDDFAERLQTAVTSLPADIVTERTEAVDETLLDRIVTDERVRHGSLKIENGKMYRAEKQTFGEIVYVEQEEVKAATIVRTERLLKIRDAVRNCFNADLQGAPAITTDIIRDHLNTHYDEFVRDYGCLHLPANQKLLAGDPDLHLLLALEDYDKDTKQATKAAVFRESTITSYVPPNSADNLSEAIGITLNEYGKLHIPRVVFLLKKDDETDSEAFARIENEFLETGLVYHDPVKDEWITKDEYLAGNVREKYAAASVAAEENPARYAKAAEELLKVIPEDLDYTEIDIELGVSWLDEKDVADFAANLVNGEPEDFQVSHTRASGWTIGYSPQGMKHASTPTATEILGTDRMNMIDIVQHTLDGRRITIYDKYIENGSTRQVINVEATDAANAKARDIQDNFLDWVWTDESRRTRLHRRYNDLFRSEIPINWDGSHLSFPGMAKEINGIPFELRSNQKNAVWRAIRTGSLLFQHEAGGGKTYLMIAAAMKMKQLGLMNKPAIAALKANVRDITNDAKKLYPGINLLSTSDQFESKKRKETVSRISTNNYDLVIMTHDHIDRLPMKPETRARHINEQLEELRGIIIASEKNKDQNRLMSRLKTAQENLETRLKDVLTKTKDESYFEETGIDSLFIDEIHYYKSLPVFSMNTDIKGIPTSTSDRAMNMFARAFFLQEKSGGRNFFGATGTSITNTVAELYIWQKFFQREKLENKGIATFDSWMHQFARTVTKLERTATGQYKQVTRLAEFTNVPELVALTGEFMDIYNIPKDGEFKRPKVEFEIIKTTLSEDQKDYIKGLEKRAQNLKRGERDNMLAISTDARKLSLDERLVMPYADDRPDSKVNLLVDRVLKNIEEKDWRTQMIFAEMGVHDVVFPDIINKLSQRIPKERIINFAKLTESQRKTAIHRLKSGEALVGLGSTKTLGTGVNAQDKLFAIHNLDTHWIPAYDEQRRKRMERDGNIHYELGEAVKSYYYLTEGGFDEIMYQANARKHGFISTIINAEGDPNKVQFRRMKEVDGEELSYEEIAAVASGNPLILEQLELQREVEDLTRAEKRHRAAQLRLKDDHRLMQEKIEANRNKIEGLKIDYDVYTKQTSVLEKQAEDNKNHNHKLKAEYNEWRAEQKQLVADGKIKKEDFEAESLQRDKTVKANLLPENTFQATILGKTVNNRTEAAGELKNTLARVVGPGKIGIYKEFSIETEVSRWFDEKRISLNMKGASGLKYDISYATEEGVFQSMESTMRAIPRAIDRFEEEITVAEKNITKIESEIGKPFKYKDRFVAALKELEDINFEISIYSLSDDEKENKRAEREGRITEEENASETVEARETIVSALDSAETDKTLSAGEILLSDQWNDETAKTSNSKDFLDHYLNAGYGTLVAHLDESGETFYSLRNTVERKEIALNLNGTTEKALEYLESFIDEKRFTTPASREIKQKLDDVNERIEKMNNQVIPEELNWLKTQARAFEKSDEFVSSLITKTPLKMSSSEGTVAETPALGAVSTIVKTHGFSNVADFWKKANEDKVSEDLKQRVKVYETLLDEERENVRANYGGSLAKLDETDPFGGRLNKLEGKPLSNYWWMIETKTDGYGRVMINAGAYELIRQTYNSLSINKPKFIGMFNEPDTVEKITEHLDKMSFANQDYAGTLSRVSATIAKASRERNGTVIFIADKRAIAHEDFHAASFIASRGKSLEERHARFNELTNSPIYQAAKPVLVKEHMTDNDGLCVEELANEFAEGNHAKYNATKEQKDEFLHLWFTSFAENNGTLTKEEFKELNEQSRQIRDEAYAAVAVAEISRRIARTEQYTDQELDAGTGGQERETGRSVRDISTGKPEEIKQVFSEDLEEHINLNMTAARLGAFAKPLDDEDDILSINESEDIPGNIKDEIINNAGEKLERAYNFVQIELHEDFGLDAYEEKMKTFGFEMHHANGEPEMYLPTTFKNVYINPDKEIVIFEEKESELIAYPATESDLRNIYISAQTESDAATELSNSVEFKPQNNSNSKESPVLGEDFEIKLAEIKAKYRKKLGLESEINEPENFTFVPKAQNETAEDLTILMAQELRLRHEVRESEYRFDEWLKDRNFHQVEIDRGEEEGKVLISLAELDKEARTIARNNVQKTDDTGLLRTQAIEDGRTHSEIVKELYNKNYKAEVELQKPEREQINKFLEETAALKQVQIAEKETNWIRVQEEVEKMKSSLGDRANNLDAKLQPEEIWRLQEKAGFRMDEDGFFELERLHRETQLPRSNEALSRLRGIETMAEITARAERQAFEKYGDEPNTDKTAKVRVKNENGELKVTDMSLNDADEKTKEAKSNANNLFDQSKSAGKEAVKSLFSPIENQINPLSPVQGKLSWFTKPAQTLNYHVNPIEIIRFDPGVQVIRAVFNYAKYTKQAFDLDKQAKGELERAKELTETIKPEITDALSNIKQDHQTAAENAEKVLQRTKDALDWESHVRAKESIVDEAFADNLEIPGKNMPIREWKKFGEKAVELGDKDLLKDFQSEMTDSDLANAIGETNSRMVARSIKADVRLAEEAKNAISSIERISPTEIELEVKISNLAKFGEADAMAEVASNALDNLGINVADAPPIFTPKEELAMREFITELEPQTALNLNRVLDNPMSIAENMENLANSMAGNSAGLDFSQMNAGQKQVFEEAAQIQNALNELEKTVNVQSLLEQQAQIQMSNVSNQVTADAATKLPETIRLNQPVMEMTNLERQTIDNMAQAIEKGEIEEAYTKQQMQQAEQAEVEIAEAVETEEASALIEGMTL